MQTCLVLALPAMGTPLVLPLSSSPWASVGDNPQLPCLQSPRKQPQLPPGSELLPHLVSIITSAGSDKGALQEGSRMQDEGLAGGEGGGLQGWDEGHAEGGITPGALQGWRGPAAHHHISEKTALTEWG